MTSDHQPDYLTAREFAELTRISHSSALSLIRSMQVPAIDVSTNPCGRPRYIVARADAMEFLASRAVRPVVATKRRRQPRATVPQHWNED